MQRAIDLIDKTIDIIGRTIAWLTAGMVVLVVAIVILRYAFQFGSIALQESVTYVNALIFTLGAAYTLKEQGHVRVDIFYSRLTERYSQDYISVSWRVRESSADPSGLPYVYLLKTTIFVLAVLLIVQGISELLKSIRQFNETKS